MFKTMINSRALFKWINKGMPQLMQQIRLLLSLIMCDSKAEQREQVNSYMCVKINRNDSFSTMTGYSFNQPTTHCASS